jgi:hypothetical protein
VVTNLRILRPDIAQAQARSTELLDVSAFAAQRSASAKRHATATSEQSVIAAQTTAGMDLMMAERSRSNAIDANEMASVAGDQATMAADMEVDGLGGRG